MLDTIPIILHKPIYPGNVGSIARAMKTMGLSQLRLIEPPEDIFNEDARKMSMHAKDVLLDAMLYDTSDDALGDRTVLFAASARERNLGATIVHPKEAASMALDIASKGGKPGFLFGAEPSGLPNELIHQAQYQVVIPANPDYPVLNLASSVQILTYELYQYHAQTNSKTEINKTEDSATHATYQSLFKRLEKLMDNVQFQKPTGSHALVTKLKKVFLRAQLSKDEANIFQGLITAVNHRIPQSDKE